MLHFQPYPGAKSVPPNTSNAMYNTDDFDSNIITEEIVCASNTWHYQWKVIRHKEKSMMYIMHIAVC